MKTLFSILLLSAPILAQASPVDCYHDSRISNLNRLESSQLCAGGDDTAPVDCFRDSRISNLNKEDSIRLCGGARRSYNPVDCYRDPRISQLNKLESISLCAARIAR
jgi:hypothetical protein